ncbi:MAG: DUF6326 family protein [Candidatus Kariarchaeaceae archaeon]|jgi:heme A synthase
MQDVKRIISALWVARMLSGLQGDVIRFMQPGMIDEIRANESDVEITNELLLIMAIIMSIPIFMSFLSLTLKDKVNRRANIIIGLFFVVWDVGFLIAIIGWQDPAYEIFMGFVYLVFTSLVVWYAWKWPTQES